MIPHNSTKLIISSVDIAILSGKLDLVFRNTTDVVQFHLAGNISEQQRDVKRDHRFLCF